MSCNMELNEAIDYLNSRGFLAEANVEKPGQALKYVKGLNGWDVRQNRTFGSAADNLYAIKEIAGVKVLVDIFLYLNNDDYVKLFFYLKDLDDKSTNIKLKRVRHITSVEKEFKNILSEYLDKVEEIITYIVKNKIKVPKNKLEDITDFNRFKELYDSKNGNPEMKKIYSVCKKYASTTSDIHYVDAYHFGSYFDSNKDDKKIPLGHKGYSFEIRRAQKDGFSRFRRMGVGQKYVMVVPETGEVWFNYFVRGGNYSHGPQKFSTPEELAKILIAE